MLSHPNLSHLGVPLLLLLLLLIDLSRACHVDDRTGLLAFKSSIKSDPSGILATWQPGTDCCEEWSGVSCSPTNLRVSRLSVRNEATLRGDAVGPGNILSGTISPSLSKLQYLYALILWNLGNITGSFPAFLFAMPNIGMLVIRNSNLSGRIPTKIGRLTALETLILTGNKFSGRIPSLANLTLLKEIDLSNNRLSGGIPRSFKHLKSLITLRLIGNELIGSIPEIFSSLRFLKFVDFSGNNLSGNVPKTLKNIKAVVINLSHNALTGPIPELPYRYLSELNLSWNKLSGTVSRSFGNFTKISTVDVSHNNLKGSSFPQVRSSYPIHILDLSYNNFRFENIPEWISRTSMKTLRLAKCGIKMKMDDWKPAASFVNIDVSENELTGTPLAILGNQTRLEGFWASGNKLRFDLKELKIGRKLKYLDISNNLVFGNVPGVFSRLRDLNVSRNHLCGRLPATGFPASAFLGNDCLCGAPLPPCKT